MAIPAARFDALRTAIQRQIDRVSALAPEVERALVAAHGPDWARLLADRDHSAGRSTSGLHDPRYLLRLVGHEAALADRFDAAARRDARLLAAIANSVAHTDLDRLRADDDATAARAAPPAARRAVAPGVGARFPTGGAATCAVARRRCSESSPWFCSSVFGLSTAGFPFAWARSSTRANRPSRRSTRSRSRMSSAWR